MRKINYLGVFFVVFLSCTFNIKAQENILKDDFDKLSLNIELGKSEYFPLEPIFLKATVSNKTGNPLRIISTPDFQRISLLVSYNGHQKFYAFPFIISASRPGFGTVVNGEQSFSENIVLRKSLAGMFPKYGQYEIQFILDNGRENEEKREIRSEIKEVNFIEPAGVNKEAVEFLQRNQNEILFWWKKTCEKESVKKYGQSLLEEFVSKYSESVFGEYAIYQLGLHFYNEGNLENAKNELEKIKLSKNKFIANEANILVAEIENKRIALKNEKL